MSWPACTGCTRSRSRSGRSRRPKGCPRCSPAVGRRTSKRRKRCRRGCTRRSGSSRSNWTGSKGKLGWPPETKRALIEPEHPTLNVTRQCELLGPARSSWYYQPVGESAETLVLLRLLDEQYTRTPFYGVRRMTAWLRSQGHLVNVKRVRRLLRLLGVEA